MGYIVGSSIIGQLCDLRRDYDDVITEEGGLSNNLLNLCGLPCGEKEFLMMIPLHHF